MQKTDNFLWELSYTFSDTRGKINLLEQYFYKDIHDSDYNSDLNWNQNHKVTLFSSIITSNKETLLDLPLTENLVISQTTSVNSPKPNLHKVLTREDSKSSFSPWMVNTDLKISKSYILMGRWNKFLGILKFELNINNLFSEINNYKAFTSNSLNSILADSENPINNNTERNYKLGITYSYKW